MVRTSWFTLAAITDAAGTFDRAAELEANNFVATAKVAAACQEPEARLIYLSSTSVYGTQNGSSRKTAGWKN